MVKAEAGILETDADAAAEEKLRTVLADLLDEPSERSWIDGHLRPLVGLSGEGDQRGDRRGESFAAWRRFFEALAAHGPAVLVFEDLQWADDGLLDFVDHLADWATGVPLLVLGTARPELLERRPGWGGGKRNAVTVSLSPLSDAETARLVAELLDRSVLPAETQTTVLSHAGGNPLYAEEYVRMLEERPGAFAETLPETVQGIIAARIDALAPAEKSLLQDAAVVGKVFWVGSLAAISGAARWEIEERLHALERREFLRRERRSSVGAESEYAFRHVLVRDVAYAQIPRARRADLHRLAAGWIESLGRPEDHAEMLAHHYLAALELTRAVGESVPELAVAARRALREAGDRALVLNAYAAAESFYRAAVDLAEPSDPERPRLLLALGRARHNTNFAAAREILEPALEALLAAGDVEGAAEAQTRLGDVAWRGGDQDGGFAGLERASALLATAPPSATKAYVLSERSRLFMVASRNEEAIRVGREALQMAQALGDIRLEAECLNTIGCARVGLGDFEGVADVERAVELATQVTDLSAQFRAIENLADTAYLLGDLRRSTELRESAWQRARELNRTPSLRWLRAELAGDRYAAGAWDEALALADAEIAESESGARHYMETRARQIRALVRMARGDLEGAVADAAEAEARAPAGRGPAGAHSDPRNADPASGGQFNARSGSRDDEGAARVFRRRGSGRPGSPSQRRCVGARLGRPLGGIASSRGGVGSPHALGRGVRVARGCRFRAGRGRLRGDRRPAERGRGATPRCRSSSRGGPSRRGQRAARPGTCILTLRRRDRGRSSRRSAACRNGLKKAAGCRRGQRGRPAAAPDGRGTRASQTQRAS